MRIDDLLQKAPVIPVLVLDGSHDPVDLAGTLVEAGLPVIEVTLRTPGALDAIAAMRSVEGALVGAGTVLNAKQFAQAADCGAQFIVSPGLTDSLAQAARDRAIPFLPGAVTASEILRGLDHGLTAFKFFPAEASGGLEALSALAAPFADVQFCPTGGIRPATAAAWLAHPSVPCVGGSWIVPPGQADLAAVRERARSAAALR